MNKKELIRIVAERLQVNYQVVDAVLEEVFDEITAQLTAGNAVRIVGFGEFQVRRRIARIGRNPQTGAEIDIPETRTPSFLAGKTLKDAVKGRV